MILSPLMGTPEDAGVTQHFRPLVGPREGRGEVATFDFVPFDGDPRERRDEGATSDFPRGCVAIPLGTPRMAAVSKWKLKFCEMGSWARFIA